MLFCPECGAKILSYNPCNKRGCPICNQKNQNLWLKSAQKRILPTRHYHLVFSIPEEYTHTWLSHKVEVAESLFVAVRGALKQLEEQEDLLVGSLLVFQSHGIGMSYKPHMHCMLSGGGLDTNGGYRELRNIPTRMLEDTVEEVFEKELGGRLGSASDEVRERIAGQRYKVYVGIHPERGSSILEYLAKRRYGVVVDIEKGITRKEEEIVIREAVGTGEERETHLQLNTFLERYINHIPPERSVMARYYGLYSNRHTEDLRKAREQIETEKEEEKPPYKELCPVCNAEVKLAFSFKKEDLSIVVELCMTNGPPKHGYIIKTA